MLLIDCDCNALGKYSKISVIPAVKVVMSINTIGTSVIQMYLRLLIRKMNDVPIHRANMANNWFAVPNIRQIVSTDPVYTKYPHAKTTKVVEIILPGIE